MEKESSQAERGQVVIIMVFALVGLLVITGLAIDGGTVFFERRSMQNAADASALAGARELSNAICGGKSAPATDAAVFAAVNEYSRRNGAGGFEASYTRFEGNSVVEYSPRVLVGSGMVPAGASGVAVTATITRSTFFMTLIGIHESSASAYALAVTGPPLMAGGLRPFGVPVQLMQQTSPGDVFAIDFDNNGGTIRWASEVAQHRGWMNLGYMWNQGEQSAGWPRAIDESAGANVIKVWMVNGWDGPPIYADCIGCRWGDYIHAKPGSNASAVCQAPRDTLFYIPVYDAVLDCPTEVPAPKAPCPHQGSSYVYHIVGFAGIKITDCDQGKKEITAELVRSLLGEGVPLPNSGFGSDACYGDTMVVTLWK